MYHTGRNLPAKNEFATYIAKQQEDYTISQLHPAQHSPEVPP